MGKSINSEHTEPRGSSLNGCPNLFTQPSEDIGDSLTRPPGPVHPEEQAGQPDALSKSLIARKPKEWFEDAQKYLS